MKVQLDLTGISRKSFGNAVLYTRDGQTLARTKPFSYRRPDSITRNTQESKFAQVNIYLKPFLTFVRIGFVHFAHNSRPWSKAISFNMHNAQYQIGIDGVAHIDLLSLHFSTGDLLPDSNTPTPGTMPNFLIMSHTPTPAELEAGNDNIRLAFIRELNSPRIHIPEYVTRREETSVFFKSQLLTSLPQFIYTYFYFSPESCSPSTSILINNPF